MHMNKAEFEAAFAAVLLEPEHVKNVKRANKYNVVAVKKNIE